MGSHSLLQGVFPTQGWNAGFLHCRKILYQMNHQERPRILEWVAYPSPVDLPDLGIEPGSLALQADSLPTELPGKPEDFQLRSFCIIWWALHPRENFFRRDSKRDFFGDPVVKSLPANSGNMGSIPGLGRFHMSWGSWAHTPQLLKPMSLSLCFTTSGGLIAKPCPTLATPWTVALQVSLSMGFSRQEY